MPDTPRGNRGNSGMNTRRKEKEKEAIASGEIPTHTLAISGSERPFVAAADGGANHSFHSKARDLRKVFPVFYNVKIPASQADLVASVETFLAEVAKVERRYSQCSITAKVPTTDFSSPILITNEADVKRLLREMAKKPDKKVEIHLKWMADAPTAPTAPPASSQSAAASSSILELIDAETGWEDEDPRPTRGKAKRKKSKAQETAEKNEARHDEMDELKAIIRKIKDHHGHCEGCTRTENMNVHCYIDKERKSRHLPLGHHALFLWAKEVKAGESTIYAPSDFVYGKLTNASTQPRGRYATSSQHSRATSPSFSIVSGPGESSSSHHHHSTAATSVLHIPPLSPRASSIERPYAPIFTEQEQTYYETKEGKVGEAGSSVGNSVTDDLSRRRRRLLNGGRWFGRSRRTRRRREPGESVDI